eukprot:1184959-Pleurochrysis_carterae.AAC.1
MSNTDDKSELYRPTLIASARNTKDMWPLVSLITNVVFMTAAVTAGVMHVLSNDHGGRAASLRATALVTSILAYVVATCTAASFGFLLVPLGRLLLRWIRLPSQERKARRVCAHRCDVLCNATPLSCARMDAVY